jgi:alpha-N-arabinofuranosidase
MKLTFTNPILSGFYPDPSICRVNDDFYLVTSTFAYFPGIPIFHSTDLLHWEQIGNAINRPGQLCFDGLQISQGLFAPTIRHHDGVFYILCTLVGGVKESGNFVITAKDPSSKSSFGEWSDPIWMPEAGGIDPSIFFDDDGKIWYCGTRAAPEGEAYSGNYEVYIYEMDKTALDAGKNPLIGEGKGIWRGALRDCIWPEGPHIYKKDGWYYLLHAEGGTGLDHAVCVARAKNIQGPWEGKKSNPILTHRHLGKRAEVINVGHADFIDDTKGNWWMVNLASRPVDGVCPLGRETFMVPIIWENDWPSVVTETGLIEKEYPLPCLPASTPQPETACDRFHGKLPIHWLVLRMPENEKDIAYSLTQRPGALRLFTKTASMRDKQHPAFAGRRIRHKDFTFSASIEFAPKAKNETAGLILLQNENFHYRLELFDSEKGLSIRLISAAGKPDEILAQTQSLEEISSKGNSLVLAARCENMKISFYYGLDQYSLVCLADNIDARILSTEYAGGFVGSLAGVFASGNGEDTGNFADCHWGEYLGL